MDHPYKLASNPLRKQDLGLATKGSYQVRSEKIKSLSAVYSSATIAELTVYLSAPQKGIRHLADDALVKIGGKQVENEVKALLAKDISDEARVEAKGDE